MKKPDYLPTGDHFNAWIIDNKDFLFDILDAVYGDGNGIWKKSILETLNINISVKFEVPASNNNGFWDVKSWIEDDDNRRWNRGFYGEYKTSLEESNIESVIRQIKKRRSELNDTVILTFDPRFERYRKVIENEGISLIVFSDALRRKLEREFDSSKSDNNSLSDFS